MNVNVNVMSLVNLINRMRRISMTRLLVIVCVSVAGCLGSGIGSSIGTAIAGEHIQVMGEAVAAERPRVEEKTMAELLQNEGEVQQEGRRAEPNRLEQEASYGSKALKAGGSQKKLAIIIDDLGNQMGGTEDILSMPVKLTVAVMPFLPTTVSDVRRAHANGHDVIVHLPMEPKRGKPEWLGPGAILSKMTDHEIRDKVEAAIDQVPYAIGVNNHMGSKITADERIMAIVLEVCRERGLLYIDSKTSYASVVRELCESKGMPRLENDIFLDDVHSIQHITGQLRKVQEKLNRRGYCIAIGHVGIEGRRTARAIRDYAPTLLRDGAVFVGISELAKDFGGPEMTPGLPQMNMPQAQEEAEATSP